LKENKELAKKKAPANVRPDGFNLILTPPKDMTLTQNTTDHIRINYVKMELKLEVIR